MSQPDFRRDVRTPISDALEKREAARNLAHVVKMQSHHDTAACILQQLLQKCFTEPSQSIRISMLRPIVLMRSQRLYAPIRCPASLPFLLKRRQL